MRGQLPDISPSSGARSAPPSPKGGRLSAAGRACPALQRPHTQQKKPVQMLPSAPAILLLRSHKPHNPYSLFFGLVTHNHRNRILSVAKFLKPLANLTRSWEYPFSEWFVVSGLGLMLRANPLNSCTLEYLLVDQVNFRLLWFGGVIAVISTSLLSLDLCNTLRSFGWAASALC